MKVFLCLNFVEMCSKWLSLLAKSSHIEQNMTENWYRLVSDDRGSVVECLKLWGRFRMDNLLWRVKQLHNYQEPNPSQVPFCNRERSSKHWKAPKTSLSVCKLKLIYASTRPFFTWCLYEISKIHAKICVFNTSETRETLYGSKIF